MINKKQQAILAKARRYKHTTYMSLPFARHYLSYCDESYVTYDRFLRLVKGTDKIVSFPTQVEPAIALDAFFEIIETQLNGKSTTNGSTTGDENVGKKPIFC
ncbi:MAG: hypothetical protein CBD16_02420 [Betaproteobacteria bacterium TMED156]|nr:MAG: hypothetical protein CBD16_02420 [Betaproteobacteria bacterium TMED156]